jgi:hypothetical protein
VSGREDELADDGEAPEAELPDEEVPPRPRRRAQSMGQSIGGVLFGFEQQVWRNIPPPHELVHHARPDDPLPAGDGGFMTLQMPDPLVSSPSRSDAVRPEPEVRELAGQATVAMRIVGPMATVDVGALVDQALPAIVARIDAAGLAVDGPPFVRYLDWGGDTADLEIGFPVAGDAAVFETLPEVRPAAGPGRSALPGGPCAVIEHVGPYADLPASWGRLMTWIWDRGLEPAGPTWESYVDNPDHVDRALLRTRVVRPLHG